MTAKGDFFPRRINDHVPNMQYAADVRYGGFGTITIPAPVAANATAGQVTGGEGVEEVSIDTGAKFGRNVVLTPTEAVGAALPVTVRGQDYLGQPVSETFTTASAGTTALTGKKAFRYVTSVEVGTGDAAGAINIGFGNVLGLPYRSIKIMSEEVDGVMPTAGTFVAGANITQTGTSDDPRGTYTPHNTVLPNGERTYVLGFMHDSDNLHGNSHFFA